MLIVQKSAAVERPCGEHVIHKVTLPGRNANYLLLKSDNLSKLRSRWALKNYVWGFDLQREARTGVSSGCDRSSLLLRSHSRAWERQLLGPPPPMDCSDSVCFNVSASNTALIASLHFGLQLRVLLGMQFLSFGV